MADHSSLLSQSWADILPPQPPASLLQWWVIVSVSLLVLVLLVVYVLWQQSPRQRAQRVIGRCRRQLHGAGVDTRRLATQVYRALLAGLAMTPAAAHRHPAADWQRFYIVLEQCVFRPDAPAASELAMLIAQARVWLRRYPG
jgi:hypothetical protein